MHVFAFARQKEIAPTFLTLNEDGILSMVMYQATLKTTTYRKIHEIEERIKGGAPIVAVFHVCEMLLYEDSKAFHQDYMHRRKEKHTELLSFQKVTKEGMENYYISNDAILEGNKESVFPTLMKVETDANVSFMKPLVDAFANSRSS